MREATGGAYLLYIAIFFISAVMIMFVSALSYNKAFRVKNHIIEIIEEYGKFEASLENGSAEKEIIDYLGAVGYSINPKYKGNGCKTYDSNAVKKDDSDTYEYCIYEYINTTTNKVYYKVVTYAYFNFPVIDNIFRYKVYGETKLMDSE